MNQQWLMKDILRTLNSYPTAPDHDFEYLSIDHALRIVDETLDILGQSGSNTEYTYIHGHRKRLAHSLSMIPKATKPGQSCLDIGSYGYMMYWAKVHLGYDHVIGIEWHPDVQDEIIKRTIDIDGQTVELLSYNFDITQVDWSITDQFQTILFFEVLEHINHDPMGVMENIHQRLSENGTLVMSVPNAISYKSLKEFLVGMPPWTYWFYQPDLTHEPRHCFEYTPIVFQSIIRAAGLSVNAFKTIFAYSEEEHEQNVISVADRLGLSINSIGETMIINATKTTQNIQVRYPDVIYSPEGYYKNIFPLLDHSLSKTLRSLDVGDLNHESTGVDHDEHIDDSQAIDPQYIAGLETRHEELLRSNEKLHSRILELEADLEQSLFNCDCYLSQHEELSMKSERRDQELSQAIIEVKNHKEWAESLLQDKRNMQSQINELLFACDCYLQKINDTTHCVQVIREQRFRKALNTSKAIARKTPIIRTTMRPVYRHAKKFVKRRL